MGEAALTLDLGDDQAAPPAAAAAPVLTGTAAVLEALIKHYRKPGAARDGEILIPEPQAPGSLRRCDLIRVSLWQSRGAGIDGHEIKTSRSDWLRELDEPEKADAWWPYCTRWWIVTPPGLVRNGELPEGWGLLEVPARGRRFKTRVAAAAKEPKLTADLLAELLRRADNARLSDLDALRTKFRRDLRDQYDQVRAEMGERALTREQQFRLDLLDKIETALGVKVTGWMGEWAQNLDRMSAAELGEALGDIRSSVRLQRREQRIAQRVERLRQIAAAIGQELDAEGSGHLDRRHPGADPVTDLAEPAAPERRTGHAHYTGTDRNGTARTGCTENAAWLAERCFNRGWLWLRIIADDDGREVGGIKLSHDRPQRRIWWAET